MKFSSGNNITVSTIIKFVFKNKKLIDCLKKLICSILRSKIDTQKGLLHDAFEIDNKKI